MAQESDESDRSVVRECYWVLCGQFVESDDPEDELKSAVIAVALATSVVALAAGTSSLLASSQNWPVAAVLFAAGVGVLVFTWFTGLHRFDEILIRS
jgi:hypothetical protein